MLKFDELAASLAPIYRPTVGNFDTAKFLKYFPFSIWKTASGRVTTNFDHKRWAPNPAFSAPNAATYWVSTAGNDSTGTGTQATPYRSINKAITVGNAAAVPYIVYVVTGTYYFGESWGGPSGTVIPSQPCAFIAVGGPVVSTCAFDGYTWTLDTGTTYTRTTATAGGHQRMMDMVNLDDWGNYTDLLKVADVATCRATPGTWFVTGTTIYANRIDGIQPTTSNQRGLIGTTPGAQCTTSGNMYVEGFDFEGGLNSNFYMVNNSTGRMVFKNCTAKYSTAGSCFEARNIDGAVFIDCTAAKGLADGFRAFSQSGINPFVIAINCTAYYMGYGFNTSTSCNAFTTHGAMRSLSINCNWHHCYGWNVAPVLGAQHWSIGDFSFASLGDVGRGGTAYASDWGTDQNSPANTGNWIDSCVSRLSDGPAVTVGNPYYSTYSDGVGGAGAINYYRNCDFEGNVGPGSIVY